MWTTRIFFLVLIFVSCVQADVYCGLKFCTGVGVYCCGTFNDACCWPTVSVVGLWCSGWCMGLAPYFSNDRQLTHFKTLKEPPVDGKSFPAYLRWLFLDSFRQGFGLSGYVLISGFWFISVCFFIGMLSCCIWICIRRRRASAGYIVVNQQPTYGSAVSVTTAYNQPPPTYSNVAASAPTYTSAYQKPPAYH